MPPSWIVLKFGGTSVASAERWSTIESRARALLARHRVWIVASAVAGVSNLLERAVGEALAGQASPSASAVRDVHRRLATELRLGPAATAPVEELLDDVDRRLGGIRVTGEAPPRLLARIMAVGELASTRLGAAALAARGLPVRWVDARELLASRPAPLATDEQRYLEAVVPTEQDATAAEAAAGDSPLVITQGFIARTSEGETCLLGRGGSDTSGALFAALLGAVELEIWTDVHGLFTADPRVVPTARLIRRIGYREAQELAAMGAKVLHPRCLEPVASARIPLSIHSTPHPERVGTRIEATDEDHPAVTAVTCRRGVTLLTLSSVAMWEAPGFLARAFAPFAELGISIDLVATSQSAVSVTLDKVPGGVRGPAFARLLEHLEPLVRVEVLHPCGVVSIVGRRIRAGLGEVGPAMEVFHDRPVRLVSASSEDLNLSFVVDEEDTSALVVRLHERLFSTQGGDPRLGETWEEIEGPAVSAAAPRAWWRARRPELLALTADGRARYVYDLPTVRERAHRLAGALRSVDRFYYSMKANAHPLVLEAIVRRGFGIECVSAEEVLRARQLLGPDVRVLFTPNYCPPAEYATALEAGAEITVDGPEPLLRQADVFRGRSIGLRVDPGRGLGHHHKVWTAGAQAKFGQARDELGVVVDAARRAGARVVGLHAHVGSGILDPGAWASIGRALGPLLEALGDVEWFDLGGGLGVSERPGQDGLDLAEMERRLAELRRDLPRPVELRLEPGRFLVSEAGVLLAPVTQVRQKGTLRFVGVATGMNSFLRPALYGAWHGIHNLSRIDEPPAGYWNVVGPICESADVLGRDRLLPECEPGDVLLVENAGAYGAVMASRYNLREPASEHVLE